MRLSSIAALGLASFTSIFGQEVEPSLSLEDARLAGLEKSKYLNEKYSEWSAQKTPRADLATFRESIQPILEKACIQCHGPEKEKASFRVDTLDPNLVTGGDVSWWLEVLDVVSNGEMPPPDEDDIEFPDGHRAEFVDWLTQQVQIASQVRRSEEGHTSFRRMTRYEFNYALQDLLGLDYDFAGALPPESASEEGFKNSSEMLQMSVMQLEEYRKITRTALEKALVKGSKPALTFYGIDLADGARKSFAAELEKAEKETEENGDRQKRNRKAASRSGAPHYFNREVNEVIANYRSNMRGRPYPSLDSVPEEPPLGSKYGFIVPGGQKASFNLGAHLPERGGLRVRIRASNASDDSEIPWLRLRFGYQPSNNSHTNFVVSRKDLIVEAPLGEEQFYEFEIPLSEIDRNPYRGEEIKKVNSTENIFIENANPSGNSRLFVDYIEVATPYYDQWPPESHSALFPPVGGRDEVAYAREVISRLMALAWRRDVSEAEVDRKMELYEAIRPACDNSEEALVDVMANLLASPNFLYLVQSSDPDHYEIATRLAMFLWSSVPDRELLDLAREEGLDSATLQKQTRRMLGDPRAERFTRHFVRQWLGMDLLDHLNVDKTVYRNFSPDLKNAMQEEPIVFFAELLRRNESILNFLHADFAMVNRTLIRHYRFGDDSIKTNEFRRVPVGGERRGGILTQAGLLAMNSDGRDSHPLKRGIWLLERVLNDPPAPPPPSVPEIDLADPRIAEMTLKERMEDHRDDPACMSCHQKIDPWGIAFENFDALGSWREKIGGEPVDASSRLFNREELAGIEGLKRYLLLNRQDQFASALVHKVSGYALGRPLAFADRSELEGITAKLRQQGDGLNTLIELIVTSDLFRN